MDSSSPLYLHTLPLDIIIDVFKSLPSFSYVPSLVLAHRAFNEAWKENFSEISQAIAHNEFQPWEDAVNLMLEQLHPDEDLMPIADISERLTKGDIAQMRSNLLYLNTLEEKHNRLKDIWGGPPLAESPTELLRFRRAGYRVWLYNLTMDLPKCELMCDVLPLIELIEMQVVGKHFEYRDGWPGLPDFSIYPPGFVVQSLEGVMRRRIGNYIKCDPEVDLDEVHDLKRSYASLNVQDPSVKGEDFYQKVERLMWFEKKWREKLAEERAAQ